LRLRPTLSKSAPQPIIAILFLSDRSSVRCLNCTKLLQPLPLFRHNSIHPFLQIGLVLMWFYDENWSVVAPISLCVPPEWNRAMCNKGKNLDLTSDARPQRRARPKERSFLGVQFACCDVYARVYVNQAETAYVGNCPRCAKRIEIGIGAGGSDSRFFTAY